MRLDLLDGDFFAVKYSRSERGLHLRYLCEELSEVLDVAGPARGHYGNGDVALDIADHIDLVAAVRAVAVDAVQQHFAGTESLAANDELFDI